MENAWRDRLEKGAQRLGVELPKGASERLRWLTDELARWNRRVNLTAIRDPDEILEKHLLDSLAILPELKGAQRLLDIGSGAGFPGLPLKLARPELEVVMLDAVGKKVGFIKHAIANLGLDGASAHHLRAGGDPAGEGIERASVVVSRALTDLGPWLDLARPYLRPDGRILAMLGDADEEKGRIVEAGSARGLRCAGIRRYRLPFSGAHRAVASFAVSP